MGFFIFYFLFFISVADPLYRGPKSAWAHFLKYTIKIVYYCTISNYSAGGVTRDMLAEILHPAKWVVTWDICPILAKGQPK